MDKKSPQEINASACLKFQIWTLTLLVLNQLIDQTKINSNVLLAIKVI